MNGLEKITDRIAAASRQETEKILTAARAEAETIVRGYEEKAQADGAAALEQATADAAYRVERAGGVAQLEARKRKLQKKQELLDKAFAAAREKLLALPEEQYAALLVNLAVDGCVTGTEALVFSTKDRPRLGKAVVIAANEKLEALGRTGNLTLSEESRDFDGGLYIQDGNIENNCTFSTILRILREQMSGDVAKILFD